MSFPHTARVRYVGTNISVPPDSGVQRVREEITNITAMMEGDITREAPVTGEMIALLTVLSLFTVVGTVGNGLVLFVFSRVRDKTTAQLFILALAMIDLFTCMLIIPLTMYVEYTRYDIKMDWLCKLYQFLITCKVPLSAFIMVAIAFDRYFCICHPLRKIITPWRTKVTIASLTLFAAMLGLMTSLAYGVNQIFSPYDMDIYNSILNSTIVPVPSDTIKDWTKLGEDPSIKNDITTAVELRLKLYMLKRYNGTMAFRKGVRETVYIGICAPNEILLDWDFVSVYQKCYTVLFLICWVIVGVLYGMIYRFIGMRRNKKLQQRLVLCAYVNSTTHGGCREAGTRITFVHSNIHETTTHYNDNDDKYETSSQGLGPGGIYIGGDVTPASLSPTPSNHHPPSVRKAGSSLNVSFAEPSSPGKPASDSGKPSAMANPGDEKKHVDSDAEAVTSLIGNSQNAVEKSVNGMESESGGKETQGGETDVRKHSQTSSQSNEGDAADSNQKTLRKSAEAVNVSPHFANNRAEIHHSNEKPSVRSPSLAAGSRVRRKRLWKSSRRPKSLAEDPDSKTSNATTAHQRLCKRRASSPFKGREVAEVSVKHSPLVERHRVSRKNRRGSEPFRNFACDAFSDAYSHGRKEDFLTMGSRNHYEDHYLETSIEDNYNMFAARAFQHPSVTSDRSSDVTSGKEVVENTSAPIIHVINDAMAQDTEVFHHPLANLSDSDTAEAKIPLLHGSREERLQGKNHSMDANESAEDTDNDLNIPLSGEQGSNRNVVPHNVNNPVFITTHKPEIRIEPSVRNTTTVAKEAPDIQGAPHNVPHTSTAYTPEIRVESLGTFEPSSAPEIRVFPTSPSCDSSTPEIRVFESLWNNQLPQSSAAPQQPALLTAYVRNVNPSSCSPNASPRHSYSDGSPRHWLMEESSVGGFPDLDPGHLLIPGTSSSRRSTMESRSRSSTMDGSVTRPPRTARKKRWQHFRSKNASIKGNQGRHYRASSMGQPSCSSFAGGGASADNFLYGRRSVVAYNADRLRDETRAANARTALMLFTVTLVFVVAFLPAWLMAHRLVPTQLMVFYLYFTYNVANPFIYAFMNVIFKEQLRKLFRCWRNG